MWSTIRLITSIIRVRRDVTNEEMDSTANLSVRQKVLM